MNPRTFYENLSREIDDEDVAKLLSVLMNHVGKENKIDRRSLVEAMYGKYNSSTWRKMRMAKARLIKTEFWFGKVSICSSSGEGGYWIAYDEEDRALYVAESGSRKAETDAVFENAKYGKTWKEIDRIYGYVGDEKQLFDELQPALFEVETEPRDYHYQWGQ
jgi:hypothetical protein